MRRGPKLARPQEYQFHKVCGIGGRPVPPYGENPTRLSDLSAITRRSRHPALRSGFLTACGTAAHRPPRFA